MGFVFFILTGFFIYHVLQFYSSKTKESAAAENYIYVLLILSLFVLLTTEICSAGNWISAITIQIIWIVLAITSGIFWWKISNRKLFFALQWKSLLQFPFIIIFGVTSITFLICMFAFPNNWDSMTYHLGRVMHWIQNGNVNPYATHIVRQVSQPPLSEYFQMHFMLLSGSDKFANLVQWMFMTGAVVATGRIGLHLTGNKTVARLSMLLAVLIPMGILQSSSTQNDMAVSFFIVAALLFAIKAANKNFKLQEILLFSISVSLACLTKGTAYIFLLPIIVMYGIQAIIKLRLQVWKPLLIGIIIFIALNGTFFLRNYSAFQHPLAPDTTLQNTFIGIQPIATNTVKNLAMHFLSPWPAINNVVTSIVIKYHQFIHTDINDPRFSWEFSPPFSASQLYPHEDYATAPFYILFFLIACAYLLFNMRKHSWKISIYALVIISMWLTFSLLLKWQVWHCRLHLPMLLASTPLIAFYLNNCRKSVRIVSIVVFILFALPSIFYNYSRPIIGKNSIFTNSKYDQYFFNQPTNQKPFFDISAIMQRNNLKNIGWIISGDSWEYPMWVLLNDETHLRMEHILVKNATQKFEDASFIPDGIINKMIEPDSLGRIYYHNTIYQVVYENDPWMFMQKVGD
ncbi:MAG: glycosyltransferase family 39 protein [Chitinophagales bacterium]|nr:glycosyltransferase family 39 protein [Chitinophagales bacterium]